MAREIRELTSYHYQMSSATCCIPLITTRWSVLHPSCHYQVVGAASLLSLPGGRCCIPPTTTRWSVLHPSNHYQVVGAASLLSLPGGRCCIPPITTRWSVLHPSYHYQVVSAASLLSLPGGQCCIPPITTRWSVLHPSYHYQVVSNQLHLSHQYQIFAPITTRCSVRPADALAVHPHYIFAEKHQFTSLLSLLNLSVVGGMEGFLPVSEWQ